MKDKIYLFENKETGEIRGVRRSSVPDSNTLKIPTIGECEVVDWNWNYLTTVNFK